MSIINKRIVCPDCGGYGERGFSLTPWIKDGRPCFVCKGTGYVLKSERSKYVKERINNCEVEKMNIKDVESLKEQIESYKKIIKEKKFTAGYRRSCQDAVNSLEALLEDCKEKDIK